jgi:hypothetical protein
MPGAVAWGSTAPLSGPSGQVTIPAASSSGTLTDPRITSTTVVLAQLQTVDVTLTRIVATPGAGVCTFTGNAVATIPVVIGYVIVPASTIG